MLIDAKIIAKIMAKNRNWKWRQSTFLDFSKFDSWQKGLLGPFFYQSTKFGAKILIDIQIMAKNQNNKKDGYHQQTLRQRQKLISIIDYDVCMTFY